MEPVLAALTASAARLRAQELFALPLPARHIVQLWATRRGCARRHVQAVKIEAFEELEALLRELTLLGIPRDVVVEHREVVRLVVADRITILGILQRTQPVAVAQPPV